MGSNKVNKLVMLRILKGQGGFTLIELVIVIVLLGIIGSMGADFISQAFIGFSKTNSRMEIFEEGKYFPDLMTKKAIDFITRNKETPFFNGLKQTFKF